MAAEEDRIDDWLQGARKHYLEAAPFAQDRLLADELMIESRPALSSLRRSFAAANWAPDLGAIDHREGLALLSLLGRRAAGLGVTPTAAWALLRAVTSAILFEAGDQRADLRDGLDVVFLEGFMAGRDDRLLDASRVAAAGALATFEPWPRCLLLPLAGDHDADVLREVVEDFGRRLFKADARSCVVDLSQLRGPAPDRASEVFTADSAARMLGAHCYFVTGGTTWIEQARVARVPIELLRFAPTLTDALVQALADAGADLRRARWRPFGRRPAQDT